MSTEAFQGLLKWRCIGPFRGGRVVAVAGDPRDQTTFYFGACAGGIWKTDDGGMYWRNVSDGFLQTASVGALEVSPSDPNVIYAGMGESTIRIDVSHGDGVYKSVDSGATWQHMGLKDTRHIAKVRVHPHDSNTVFVAALGHAFGPNTERGVYKSSDGGETWRQVFFHSEKAGAIDLSIDQRNPRIIYAAMWEAYRSFWDISSGGPGSGLYKSVDGGETWQNITSHQGLPQGILGKIGVVTSPARSGRVWALIEHKDEGGLYRSDDAGQTWERVSDDQRLISRAWYYMHLTADPVDAETLYVNNLSFWCSHDGGRNFHEIATPHGDNHDLWIDPNNPRRMVQGNDGGACVSFNGGASWSTIYNQPTAQFYHLDTDSRAPYCVYGTQQDNSSIGIPSRSIQGSIRWPDCFLAGTGESGYIAVKPDDPNIVFIGAIGSSPGGGNALQRFDYQSKQVRLVTTWPETMVGYGAEAHKYRFAWTYPIVFSPHDPQVLYIGGNHVMKSTNEGQSWQCISPDLTRATSETLKPSGGPINKDAVGAETFATVFALAESPLEPGILWAGSDDGLVHISRDHGVSWHNVTPPEMPQAMVSMLEPSPHHPGTIYLAATRYKYDDPAPYLYRSDDYGQSWHSIVRGMPADDFTRVIRADPEREGLLFVGTETGLYISFDHGKNWARFQLNLPVVPIYDLKIKDNDLVVATHGRAFWILDDIAPLRQHSPELTERPAHLFAPSASLRILPIIFEGIFSGVRGKNYMNTLGSGAAFEESITPEGITERTYLDSGTNPPKGAVLSYYLKEALAEGEKLTLSIHTSQGELIREFTSQSPAELKARREKPSKHREVALSADVGYNRFCWDLRLPSLLKIQGDDTASEIYVAGPMVVPGDYLARLHHAGDVYEQPIHILPDPSVHDRPGLAEDLAAQFALWHDIYIKAESCVTLINQMRDIRAQLRHWQAHLSSPLSSQAETLHRTLKAIESQLCVPDLRPGWADGINAGTRLFAKITDLIPIVSAGNYRPTEQLIEVFKALATQLDEVIATYQQFTAEELTTFNQALLAEGTHYIRPPS